ncbi:hypothetical protein ElyMa_002812000 [Elysia marginata]|uniref:Uncharacterized protein n=1 Tax=Elysia marginata TaxID=1093978 RepID=A0AAV4HS96_9GAST|nr:hypothetical protein ElyMa_002812000 [Elysia marginata]
MKRHHGQAAGDGGTDPDGDDQTPNESVEDQKPEPKLTRKTAAARAAASPEYIHVENDRQETVSIVQHVPNSSETAVPNTVAAKGLGAETESQQLPGDGHGQAASDGGTGPDGDDQTSTESAEGGGGGGGAARPSLETETRQDMENAPEAVQHDTQLQQQVDQRETPAEAHQEEAIQPEINITTDSPDNRGSAGLSYHNEGPEVRRLNRNMKYENKICI